MADNKELYYVYLEGPNGKELIGIANGYTEAQKLKMSKDKDWKPGYMWKTIISNKELKETNFWD